ncbi:hypothetical protein EAG_13983 [Camponotus floridanus]|uniref:Uncharacterized protein n=1 Tax=Camponotus floridanus TaxID=104421 RepID=E2A3G7_CAMFO|nr:hypothetical protein EAG_13983 [Camponotus floridanus]
MYKHHVKSGNVTGIEQLVLILPTSRSESLHMIAELLRSAKSLCSAASLLNSPMQDLLHPLENFFDAGRQTRTRRDSILKAREPKCPVEAAEVSRRLCALCDITSGPTAPRRFFPNPAEKTSPPLPESSSSSSSTSSSSSSSSTITRTIVSLRDRALEHVAAARESHRRAVEPRTRSVEGRRRESLPNPRGTHRDARRVDRDRAHPVAPLPALVAILRPWRRKRRGRCKDRAPSAAMSIRVSGVYLVPSPGADNGGNDKSVDHQEQHHHHHHHHHHSKTVTIVTAPQRSNSLDYLNFEEKRQIIASSLSLSDFLAHGPAAAAAAAKEVAANTVIEKSTKYGEKFAVEIESRLALDMLRKVAAKFARYIFHDRFTSRSALNFARGQTRYSSRLNKPPLPPPSYDLLIERRALSPSPAATYLPRNVKAAADRSERTFLRENNTHRAYETRCVSMGEAPCQSPRR